MKTIINIKADKDVKTKAQKIAKDLGLSLSVVVNAQLKQFILDEAIYFSTQPTMSPRLEKLVSQVERDIKKGQNISRPFSSGKEMDDYLHSL